MTSEKYNIENISDARGVVIGEHNTIIQYFQGQYRPLAQHLISFDRIIEKHTINFVGRVFLFKKLDEFISQHGCGYFVLEGEPGIGKTAIVCSLASSRPYYLHHFNIASMGINRPEQFLENICAQLIARYDLEVKTLPDNTGRDGKYLVELLEKVSRKIRDEDEKLVILIDALDEVQMPMSRTNLLYLPEDLPKGIYCMLTTRPGRLALRTDTAFESFFLRPDSPENRSNVRAFIEKFVNHDQIQACLKNWKISGKDFVDTLLEKSEGNFMYLHYVLPAIEQNPHLYGNMKELPHGLKQYYESHWDRMRLNDEDANWKRRVKVVCVLSELEEAVSAEVISEFSREELLFVQHTLVQWLPFLDVEEIKGRKVYRIYHASFRDFLQESEIIQIEIANREIKERAEEALGELSFEKLDE